MVMILVAFAFARDAYADAKTKQLVTGYQREARNCKIQSDGVTKVLDGATTMQAEINDPALAEDITKLRGAQEPIQAFCTELAAVIELLRADPAATYKSLEPQLSERDKKLRELRKAFKLAADGATPIIRRLVPRINKRVATAASATAKKPEPAPTPPPAPAPVAPPPPVVKLSDGPTTSVAVHSFTGGTCDDQAKAIAKAEPIEREPPKKRTAGTLAWLPGAKWRTSTVAGDRLRQVECVATKTGGFIVTLEGPNAAERDVIELGARALAASAKP
jgi:hypothetical protein